MLDSEIFWLLWGCFTLIQLVFLGIVWMNTRYVKPLTGIPHHFPLVSVMVPMRNESKRVNELTEALTRQDYPNLEILYLDDHSEDDTWLKMLSRQWMHPGLLLYQSLPLPQDWLGKNHACHQLSQKARGEILLFADADVLPMPNAVSATVAAIQEEHLDFLSLFPEQIPATPYQKQVLPLMDFFLYTFLPFPFISKSSSPAFAAANGQWMAFTRNAYDTIGGHAAVRNRVIEDMALARNIKSAGMRMNTYSGTGLVSCRMYDQDEEMQTGFGKNIFAAAGFSAFRLISFLSLLAFLFLLPFIIFFIVPIFIINIIIIWGIRYLLAKRFRHSIRDSIWLHPVGMIRGIRLAWSSMRQYQSGSASWKGRTLNKPA